MDSLPAVNSVAAFVVDHELRYLVAEGDALEAAGLRPEDLIGKTIFEALDPSVVELYESHYRRVLRGESFTHEYAAHGRAFRSRGVPMRDASGRIYAALVVSMDVTTQPQGELLTTAVYESVTRQGFLLRLSDALRPVADPIEIQRTAARVLGEHLGVSRVLYAEIEDGKVALIGADYVNGVEAMTGRRPLEICGEVIEPLRQGNTLVIQDVASDPRIPASVLPGYEAAQTRALIATSLLKDDCWVATLAAHSRTPRLWTPAEIMLLRETAERTWSAVERARAELVAAQDLRYTKILHEAGTRLVSEETLPALYDDLLQAAMSLTEADAGTVQILDREGHVLELLATKGFPPDMVRYFERVDARSSTCCGVALTGNARTFIEFDAPELAELEPMRLHVQAGYHSAQSTPLITREGRLIGRVSTHWRSHAHRPTERQLRFLDLLARQAADLLERRQSELSLRASREQLAIELENSQRLQRLSATLVAEQEIAALHATILDTALAIMGADFASLQLHPASPGAEAELELVASRGFTEEARARWKRVAIRPDSPCSEALRTRRRFTVPDIEKCDFLAATGDQEICRGIGIRALQVTPLVTRGGRVLGMIATQWRKPHEPRDAELRRFDILARELADLMERNETADALRRSERALQQADRRKDEFLATLAHELRNPLATIRSGLELLRHADETPAMLDQVRSMMERQVGHMVRMIDDLLDVSRITSGKIRLQRTVAPLTALIDGAVEANRAGLDAGQLVLTVDLPPEPVFLDVDPTRFVQVLSNLLHNAIKFSDAGGRIAIAGRVAPPAEAGRRELILTVADTGIGITDEMLPRVFQLFAQAESVADRAHAGLGIGLALARRLLELQGGTIEAYSEGAGKGSTFTIRLPVVPGPALSGETTARESHGPIRRRVLVVDDNVDAADSLCMLVRSLGAECAVAYHGEAALARALEFRPEVVLLDISMPGIDGYETCRRLRTALGLGPMIVALSGRGLKRDREAAARAGFDAHLTKPADPDGLERLLTGTTPGEAAVAAGI